MKSFSCASLCTSCLINELFSSGMFVMRSTGMPKVPDNIKINIFPRNTVNNLNLANKLKALHDGPTQEVLPVISGDIVNQIVAHVTQEFISQLTSLLHSISNSKPLSNLGPLKSLEARVNQETLFQPQPCQLRLLCILQLWLRFYRYPWHQHGTSHLCPQSNQFSQRSQFALAELLQCHRVLIMFIITS